MYLDVITSSMGLSLLFVFRAEQKSRPSIKGILESGNASRERIVLNERSQGGRTYSGPKVTGLKLASAT